jgi:hypothetical protein
MATRAAVTGLRQTLLAMAHLSGTLLFDRTVDHLKPAIGVHRFKICCMARDRSFKREERHSAEFESPRLLTRRTNSSADSRS